MKKFTIVPILAAAVFHAAAEDVFNFANIPVTGGEAGVLVLAPGMNANGAFFLDERPWMEFARENSMGVMALNYKSDPEKLYGGDREGYYFAEQGSGQALLDEIRRIYGKDLPILIYGFSGGAQFAGRFIDFAPNRIIAWCAYSAQFWDTPTPEGTKARGIVACGDLDGLRWQPSYAFFYGGRKLGKPWIWVGRKNTGHVRSAKFEAFIRDFFQEELDIQSGKKTPGGNVYADVSTMEKIDADGMNKGLSAVFRSVELYEKWKEIHAP